jgi:hypothetical protein
MSFDILKHVTSLPQRPGRVSDQLANLIRADHYHNLAIREAVANKLGLYDAARLVINKH